MRIKNFYFFLILLIFLNSCSGTSSRGLFGTGVSVATDPRSLGTQIDDSIMKKLLNLIFLVFVVFIFTSKLYASEEKIRIGLLLPLNGQNQDIGKSVLRSVNLAINKIDDPILEIYPKNNFDNPEDNIRAAQELYGKPVELGL